MSVANASATRAIFLGSLSAAVYFSAGVAFYYFFKKIRNREQSRKNSKKDVTRRGKSKRSSSRSKSEQSVKTSAVDTDGGESDTGVSSCSSCATGSLKHSPKHISRKNSTGAKNELIDEVFQSKHINTGANAFSFQNSIDSPNCSTNLPLDNTDDKDEKSAATFNECDPPDVKLKTDTPESNCSQLSPAEETEIVVIPKERHNLCDVEVSTTMSQDEQNIIYATDKYVESPSVSYDGQSEASHDSGKGTSTCITSVMSPINEMIELPPMYEFEIPQDIVGLIIGRKGITIKYFTDESGAHIVIRHHYYSNKHKICTIEGTRDQINKCLRLIRHKFPPSRFPELKLTPLLPPPIISTHSPVLDAIINLSLPEGVKCEVVLSSMVDAGRFFIQQPTHPSFMSLSRLDQYMLAVYSQPAGVPTLPSPIDVGIICAAPVLAGWYRAQTIATFEETDEVMVKFVDYGGYGKISSLDLRQIRSDFMTLPFQAVECCLANVKPANSKEWPVEANEFFEKAVHGRVAETFLVSKDLESGTPFVELYCLIDDQFQSINDLLVEHGHAERTVTPTESDETTTE